MIAITTSTFRKKLKEYLNRVVASNETIIIPRNGGEKDAIVVMSISEYNSIKETQYIMSTRANKQELDDSIKEIESGEYEEMSLQDFQDDVADYLNENQLTDEDHIE